MQYLDLYPSRIIIIISLINVLQLDNKSITMKNSINIAKKKHGKSPCLSRKVSLPIL